jgi:hypothetical protein
MRSCNYPKRNGSWLSETGFWHTFAPRDAVEACGGPQEFAAQIAEAKLTGKDGEFMEGFEGRVSDRKKRMGKHTAAVTEAPKQPELF